MECFQRYRLITQSKHSRQILLKFSCSCTANHSSDFLFDESGIKKNWCVEYFVDGFIHGFLSEVSLRYLFVLEKRVKTLYLGVNLNSETTVNWQHGDISIFFQ